MESSVSCNCQWRLWPIRFQFSKPTNEITASSCHYWNTHYYFFILNHHIISSTLVDHIFFSIAFYCINRGMNMSKGSERRPESQCSTPKMYSPPCSSVRNRFAGDTLCLSHIVLYFAHRRFVQSFYNFFTICFLIILSLLIGLPEVATQKTHRLFWDNKNPVYDFIFIYQPNISKIRYQ